MSHAQNRGRLRRSLRATFFGLAANLVLAGIKLAAGILGHSHALIADAVESFGDAFSSIIVWRGLVVASVPADADHPYGHGKAEPIAAALVGAMLFVAAAGISIHSVKEIFTPHLAPRPFTLLVLALVILVKETLFRFLLKESAAVESSAVHSDAWHHRSDAITSVAAAIGIAVALVGGPGYEVADDYAAVVAAVIIAWSGWRILRVALDELMDTAPRVALSARIRDVSRSIPGVEDVEKCLIRKMGCQYYVDMHLEVDPEMSVQRAHEIAHKVKDKIRTEWPAVYDVLVHIEPGKRKTEQAAGPDIS